MLSILITSFQVRNVTQTSVTLEWSALNLAKSKLRSLDIYRNGQRLAAIPSAHTNKSTKLSGLELDTGYTFQLILRTSAGTFPSNLLEVQTHTMSNTSGIVVCLGPIEDEELRENAKSALQEMGAKWSEKIEIDTSHFVCDTPRIADGMVHQQGQQGGAKAVAGYAQVLGVEYQRALQLSIPTVQPSWILACHGQKRYVVVSVFALNRDQHTNYSMAPVSGHYLGTSPPPTHSQPRAQSLSNVNVNQQTSAHAPASTSASTSKQQHRQSMPAVPTPQATNTSPFVNQAPSRFEPTPEDSAGEQQAAASTTSPATSPATSPTTSSRPAPERTSSVSSGPTSPPPTSSTPTQRLDPTIKVERRKSQPGTMNREFKFPPSPPQAAAVSSPPSTSTSIDQQQVGVPTVNVTEPTPTTASATTKRVLEGGTGTITPSSIEVPPPPPVEKETPVSRSRAESDDDDDDGDVGDVVEVDLS